MPDESPATTLEAPTATGEQAPVASAPAAGAETPATPAPEAPAAVEPDLDALLSKPETIEKLLQHDRAKKEIEHRAKSIREADIDRRAEEKANARLQAWQAEQAARQREMQEAADRQAIENAKRLIEEDPTHPLAQWAQGLIEQKSRDLAASDAARQAQKAQAEQMSLATKTQMAAYARTGEGLFTVARNLGLDDATLAALTPSGDKYKDKSFEFWAEDVVRTIAEHELKALRPKERSAIEQQIRGELREQERSPARLPDGTAGENDNQIIARLSEKQVWTDNDHKQWQSIKARL